MILRDEKNVFFISFLTEMEIKLEKDYVIKLLSLDDELKVNTVLYYITRKFRYGISRYKYSKSEENIKYLDDEIKKLYEIFIMLNNERAVYLIVNYIFVEDNFPNFFIDLLKATDKKIVIENLQRQNLRNIYNLIYIDFFIKKIGYNEIEKLFVDNLILFIKEDFNIYICKSTSDKIIDIINSLNEESKIGINRELEEIKTNLYLSKFDKQVRNIRYHNDMTKKIFIEEIENIIKSSL